VYQRLGQNVDYVRQAAFSDIQREQMVLRYVEVYGRITRSDVVELCRVTPDQAKRLLDQLTQRGLLRRVGVRKGAHYVAAAAGSAG
jgi:ATP-dependent DNA helicase RecG